MAENIETLTRFVKVSEDWYPCRSDSTVEVLFITYPKNVAKKYGLTFRVAVWGDDDFGMERDYQNEDGSEAFALYMSIWDGITQKELREMGFHSA